MAPKFDLDTVPVVFINGSHTQALIRELSSLPQAAAVSFDTETVYSQEAEQMVTLDPDGNQVTYTRNLEVDGPGMWRVLSIAARFGSMDNPTYKSWVVDMRDADVATLASLITKVRPYGWNAKFDRLVLTRSGVRQRAWWDVMYLYAILRAGANGSDVARYTSLATAAYRELGIVLDGKNDTRLSYDETTDLTPEQIQYAARDAIVTLLLGDLLGARARVMGLVPTFKLECGAQPLTQQMTNVGLPFDTASYLANEVEPARQAAADAAERLAILTTGRTLLTTVSNWAARTLGTPVDDVIATGLEVLRDRELFDRFIVDVRAAADAARTRVAVACGGKVQADDLFSDGPVALAPFVIDDENDIRKWLSKMAPTFAASVVATTLNPELSLEEAQAMSIADPQQFTLESAGKKRLVKAHPLDELVLPGLVDSKLPEVTDDLRAAARALLDYRRYMSILDTYGAAMAPVRLVPDWKVNAPGAVVEALNTYAADQVKAYFKAKTGTARLLGKADSVDHDQLVLIGGELATTLLEYRKHDKTLSTYGEDFLEFVHPVTGRVHARYTQALTGTGRLSSEKPNAQNLPPAAKKYIRPAQVEGKPMRVLVVADLSQAELRYVADQSGDQIMLEAFAKGEDLHTRTASLMFNLDLVALNKFVDTQIGAIPAMTVEGLARFRELFCAGDTPKVDPARGAASVVKELRQKAKRVAFGYAYGLKGASLAIQLTVDGVPTTKEEADELLALFDKAYPAVAAWMGARVAYVAEMAAHIQTAPDLDVDFSASWALHSTFAKVKQAATALKNKVGYSPSAEEIAEHMLPDDELAAKVAARHPDLSGAALEAEISSAKAAVVEQVQWAHGFDYPSILTKSGATWAFESRTAGGRVRWFPVLTRDWEWGMVQSIVRERDRDVVAARNAWVETYNATQVREAEQARAAGKVVRTVGQVTLTEPGRNGRPGRTLFGKDLEKQFEDRARRTDLVRHVLNSVPHMVERIMRAGMADRVRFMTNQYRNHPVQGGVADAVLDAMERIDSDLTTRFPNAWAIQSVHDSLAVECDINDAKAVRDLMVRHMEEALNRFCPTVVAKADADIQLSLDDSTKLSDEQVEEMAQSDLALAA